MVEESSADLIDIVDLGAAGADGRTTGMAAYEYPGDSRGAPARTRPSGCSTRTCNREGRPPDRESGSRPGSRTNRPKRPSSRTLGSPRP